MKAYYTIHATKNGKKSTIKFTADYYDGSDDYFFEKYTAQGYKVKAITRIPINQ